VPERAVSDRTPFAHRTESLPRCIAPTALNLRESQTQGFRPGL